MISIIIPTHNAAARTRATAAHYLSAADMSKSIVEVVVVDDGSRVDERGALQANADPRVRFVMKETNLGRGGAINAGAHVAAGKWLLIVDCDCPPASLDFFIEHKHALQAGADISIGSLKSSGNNFWSRYQNEAVLRRQSQFAAGYFYAFTTSNVLLNAEWFKRVGGFDTAYARYGFEDRDLFIRLIEAGARIAYTPTAGVVHEDENLRLATILSKMRDAGEFTAARFQHNNPEAYRVLGYAAIDARLHPWLRPVSWVLGRLVFTIAPYLDPLLERLPFPIAKSAAKMMTAIAFLHGTAHPAPLD